MIDPSYLVANIEEARPLPWRLTPATEIEDHTHCIVCIRSISPSTDERFYRADVRALCIKCFDQYVRVGL